MRIKTKETDLIYINSMLKNISYINQYINEVGLDTFMVDRKSVNATAIELIQIGEAIKKLSDETISKYSNIDFINIRNLRHRIVHDYDGIDLKILYKIVKDEIPQLKIDLEQIKLDYKN
ncbi:MAG: DUF86 domain-containing protein [Clostridia bacterium]|nr:DUF86 domain-containing protein [Clostridia bacterium]